MYADSLDLAGPSPSTLTDTDVATRSFWPTIADFGLPYNLLVLAKVERARAAELADAVRRRVGRPRTWRHYQAAGLLYEIDMSILASLGPFTALDGDDAFHARHVTVLKQDPTTQGADAVRDLALDERRHARRVYNGGDNAWLYALQAAKTSITVWGIWLGHVYHWHIVTAAMQMTMYNKLPAGHRLWPLLIPSRSR